MRGYLRLPAPSSPPQVYYDLEEYENCIADFSLGLEKKLSPSQSYNSFFYRGIAYRKINQLEKSIASLKGCLELDSAKSDGHNHLGLSYAQMGEYLAARDAFSDALKAHKEKIAAEEGQPLGGEGGGGEEETGGEDATVVTAKYLNNLLSQQIQERSPSQGQQDFMQRVSSSGGGGRWSSLP